VLKSAQLGVPVSDSVFHFRKGIKVRILSAPPGPPPFGPGMMGPGSPGGSGRRLSGFKNSRAAAAAAVANLRRVVAGVLRYAHEHNGALPPMQDVPSMHKAVLPYVHDMKLFWSPGTRLPFHPNSSLSGRTLSS